VHTPNLIYTDSFNNTELVFSDCKFSIFLQLLLYFHSSLINVIHIIYIINIFILHKNTTLLNVSCKKYYFKKLIILHNKIFFFCSLNFFANFFTRNEEIVVRCNGNWHVNSNIQLERCNLISLSKPEKLRLNTANTLFLIFSRDSVGTFSILKLNRDSTRFTRVLIQYFLSQENIRQATSANIKDETLCLLPLSILYKQQCTRI